MGPKNTFVFNRPGVAGAVLQTPPSFIHKVSQSCPGSKWGHVAPLCMGLLHAKNITVSHKYTQIFLNYPSSPGLRPLLNVVHGWRHPSWLDLYNNEINCVTVIQYIPHSFCPTSHVPKQLSCYLSTKHSCCIIFNFIQNPPSLTNVGWRSVKTGLQWNPIYPFLYLCFCSVKDFDKTEKQRNFLLELSGPGLVHKYTTSSTNHWVGVQFLQFTFICLSKKIWKLWRINSTQHKSFVPPPHVTCLTTHSQLQVTP